MITQIALGEIVVDVVKKDIKNIHLSVYPPIGKVRISAPARMDNDLIRVFALSKLDWIKRQQKKLREQARETPREHLDRETHYLWGKRCLLQIMEQDAAPRVEVIHRQIALQVRPGTDSEKRREILETWYRETLKTAVPPLIAKWEAILGVKVERFFAQRMKTRWGSCNPRLGSIRLNTDLAKKPPECLEYLVAHEMMHLLEPTHNRRFIALMDRFMPRWKYYQEELNRLPVRHEKWDY